MSRVSDPPFGIVAGEVLERGADAIPLQPADDAGGQIARQHRVFRVILPSRLTEAGEREAIARLRRHAETLGVATELALSLPKQAAPITLTAPHRAA